MAKTQREEMAGQSGQDFVAAIPATHKVGDRENRMKRHTLQLNRPVAILDLETTGTSVEYDRIAEIAILKIHPNGKKTKFRSLVNPKMPIPPEATKVHGISDKDVKRKPSFRKLAAIVERILRACDLVGFNAINFDLPLLRKEFERGHVTFTLDERRILDPYRIFIRKEPRNLPAAYSFYCGREHTAAHSALGDARACWHVLRAQLKKYADLPCDLDGLNEFCNATEDRYLNSGRKFEWRHNKAAFAFGKHHGEFLQQVTKETPEYLAWMLERDFPPDTKRIVHDALAGKFPSRS